MRPLLAPRPARRSRRPWPWIVVLALVAWALHPGAARAIQSVAVLDLDGYGVSWETTQVMTQGLRDGFLEESTFDPLSGYDIGEGLSMGQGESLRRARELLGSARQRMDGGDTAGALRELAEVLGLHENAWSWVARRPELADAHYFTALALARLGRSTEAVDHLVECLYLYPGYDGDRVTDLPPSVEGMFTEARQQLDEGERRVLPGSRIATIGQRLNTTYVVAGYVVTDGTVHVGLYQDGRLVAEATASASELPLYPGDPFYYDMAVQLVGGDGQSASGSGGFPAGGTGADEDLGDFHDIPVVEVPPASDPGKGSIGTSDGGRLTDQGSSYARNERNNRRRGHKVSGIRYERKPVTETWWFWTGLTAVVAGGGVGLYLLLQEETPETNEPIEQDSYTLTVDPSDIAAR